MTNSDAVARIHAAIRRIETAIVRREEDDGALRQRHAALREEVSRVIVSIDAVVDGEER